MALELYSNASSLKYLISKSVRRQEHRRIKALELWIFQEGFRQVHELTCGTQAVHHIAGAACSTHAWHVAAVGGWPAVGYSLALNAGLPRVVAVIAVTALCHADLRLGVSLNNAMVLQHLQKIDMPPTNLLILRGIKSGTRPDVMQLWQRLQDAVCTSHCLPASRPREQVDHHPQRLHALGRQMPVNTHTWPPSMDSLPWPRCVGESAPLMALLAPLKAFPAAPVTELPHL